MVMPGAHAADVILPAAAYTEKNGTYVNLEGRVQQSNKAIFAPGDAREDWSILRALSDVIGKKLPFDSFAELRAKMAKDHPELASEGSGRTLTGLRHRDCPTSHQGRASIRSRIST